MSEPAHEQILNVALSAAREAGAILERYREEGFEVRNKSAAGEGSHNLVTAADIASENRIAEIIRASFGDHELLGEEQLRGTLDAEHLWVIDPLDGTNNFAHGMPHFAVSIAYCHHGKPEVAVVFNPARNDLYTAVIGQGARYNSNSIKVSQEASLGEAIIACGFHYDRGAMMQRTLDTIGELFRDHRIHGIRRMGTAALDLCGVACGQFGGFFEYYLSPWDFAAGKLIVTEAGGIATTEKGEPLKLEASGMAVSNGLLHDELLKVLGNHQ